MSRESLVLLFGIIVFVTPSLGIPEDWKTYIIVGSGIFLMLTGYMLRRSAYLRSTDAGNGARATDSFVESAKKESQDVILDEEI